MNLKACSGLVCSGLVILVMSLGACGPASKSSVGFRLPDGDAELGKQAYTDLACGGCHQIEDSDLPFTGEDEPIMLGGEVSRVKNYGGLVTSVINPSHKIAPGFDKTTLPISGESPMLYAGINEVMTVQQLIDVVAFLQVQYEVVPPKASYPRF